MVTTDDPDLAQQIRTAGRTCDAAVSGRPTGSPAQVFGDLARACEELGVDTWDGYAEGGPVESLERDLVDRFGVEAAAYFPSGVMAQQAALRVHCDRAGSRRVAMPDLSHLLVHEEDGPRLLHDLDVLHLTTGFEAPTAAHLAKVPGRLGAVLVELPLRDAGCLLPTWDELVALSESTVLLFVRHEAKDEFGTSPYLFLGPATYVSHTGDRPIAITWKLHHPMPTDLFTLATALAQ